MDSLIFHLDADKAGLPLLESIKAYFGNRRIQITVKPDDSEPAALPAPEADDSELVLPYEDIARIANALARNEPVDIGAEMKKFMEAT